MFPWSSLRLPDWNEDVVVGNSQLIEPCRDCQPAVHAICGRPMTLLGRSPLIGSSRIDESMGYGGLMPRARSIGFAELENENLSYSVQSVKFQELEAHCHQLRNRNEELEQRERNCQLALQDAERRFNNRYVARPNRNVLISVSTEMLIVSPPQRGKIPRRTGIAPHRVGQVPRE